ncbi:MAG: hypothetical protein NC920_01220 [Candidatus Omnitrophica bacterium]|nr:hypothetical protein [Candidatus Omnitrophota bacterium]MCM8798463.1 hypothetical protein [Candidatus Omnitrophota bacterium]
MKVTHFLFLVFIFTSFALICVWQNIHQVELSYQILQREKIINSLNAQNRILKYNVAQLKSPSYLERKILAKQIGLKYTKPVLVISPLKEEKDNSLNFVKKLSLWQRINKLISKLFTLKSQAEAKP